MARSRSCPCGSAATYDACCARLHLGEAAAATAEQLMRARFAAYAVGDEAYLLRSWHPRTRPTRVDLDPRLSWSHLEVLAAAAGGLLDVEGTVEFRASYLDRGRPGVLHERSRFVRDAGAWTYWGSDG